MRNEMQAGIGARIATDPDLPWLRSVDCSPDSTTRAEMTMAIQNDTHATYPVLDAASQDLLFLDTGQLLDAAAETIGDKALAVTFHEIHREDEGESGEREMITSTLKYFSLHMAVQSPVTGDLLFDFDGTTLIASLVYDNGELVTDVSATLEPPLLAAAGECPPKAVVEGGVATFRLRITVLSSLCNKHNFCVRVTSQEFPELSATTAAVKTITKLRRGVRGGEATTRDAPVKRQLLAAERMPLACAENGATTPATLTGSAKRLCALGESHGKCGMDEASLGQCLDRTLGAEAVGNLDELWDQVAQNGARLLELQAQQRKLFKELRALKSDGAPTEAPTEAPMETPTGP